MATLAVQQHQGVIGCQITEVRRADDRGRVADRLRIDVIRRYRGTDQIRHIGAALVAKVVAANDVDGSRRIIDRAGFAAGTGYDDFFQCRTFLGQRDRSDAGGQCHLRRNGERKLLGCKRFHVYLHGVSFVMAGLETQSRKPNPDLQTSRASLSTGYRHYLRPLV